MTLENDFMNAVNMEEPASASCDFLNDLNDSQRQAVEYIDGPSLVIAGAGSGKTRVLTYKIVYLLSQGIKPWEIMALTFTNKAAREMKERIAQLVGSSRTRYLYMGTFHSIFARLLRSEANAIGYDRNFTIYDESDSRSLCKACIKDLKLDEKVYKPTDVHCRISDAKNRLMTAQAYESDMNRLTVDAASRMPEIYAIYKLYEERCKTSNAMDFDDLLLNTYLLFKRNDEVRRKYAEIFQFFLIDEYQDTNFAQQQIILQLASEHKRICVVGDDAQSIYGFRGANIDNILDFQSHYQGAQLFKLEQNYRSTQTIVNAANSLIDKNQRQIRKSVFSQNDIGNAIRLQQLTSDREEAAFVAHDIRNKVMRDKMEYSDFAILYRTNYQSRTFEEQLLKEGMPYRIYGGMSFYQRKEIKDTVAYFRLVCNPYDEEALKRIINYPARGIGDTTVGKLLLAAHTANMSVWQVLDAPESYDLKVNKGTLSKLNMFRAQIGSFVERLVTDDAFTLGKDIIMQMGISADLYSSTDPEYVSRQENLEEFLSSIHEFVEMAREEGSPTGLNDFLHEVSLLSDKESEDDLNRPQINLMTIHSAKGLEFPHVYVVGMEENIFPSPLCTDSQRKLEEERRLLYVAITRAEKECTLSFAKMRFRYGKMEFDAPSRFLKDIDPTLLQVSGSAPEIFRDRTGNRRSLFGTLKPDGGTNTTANTAATTPKKDIDLSYRNLKPVTPSPSASTDSSPYAYSLSEGTRVIHDRFGQGTVINMDGSGANAKTTINFDNVGTKILLLKYAKLKVIPKEPGQPQSI